MIRFINLGTQINDENEFAFFDTVTDSFCKFAGTQTWKSIYDFKLDYFGDDLDRYLKLIPPNWKSPTIYAVLCSGGQGVADLGLIGVFDFEADAKEAIGDKWLTIKSIEKNKLNETAINIFTP